MTIATSLLTDRWTKKHISGDICNLQLEMEIKEFIHKCPSKRRFWNGIYSWLRRADARGGADTIYCMWRISLLYGSGIDNVVTKVGHAQNIYYQRIVL